MSQKRWTVTFAPAGEGEYQVAVKRSGAVHRFTTKLPPDISDLWKQSEDGADTGPKRSFRSGDAASLTPEQRFFQAADLPTLKIIGERVLEAVFDLKNSAEGPKIIGALEDRISDNEGVEIEFDLSQTAELSGIPWESVYLPSRDRFLAIGTTSNLVRRLDAQSELPPPIERPIRILVAAANPRADLDTDVELGNIERRISELVTEGAETFEVQSLPKATRDQFRRKVLEWKPHIVHYIGHSAFRDGQGYLYFESDKDGESDKVSAETLRNMLLNQRPWLVVLNSCQSGQTSRDAPMAGVAQNLLQRLNIPFVVAMQQPVSDDAAINFSQDFYTSLTDGQSVANAVSNGRCAIANDSHPLTQLELITPALYTSGETDHIHFIETTPVAAAASAETANVKEAAGEEKDKGILGLLQNRIVQISIIVGAVATIAGDVVGMYDIFFTTPTPAPTESSAPEDQTDAQQTAGGDTTDQNAVSGGTDADPSETDNQVAVAEQITTSDQTQSSEQTATGTSRTATRSTEQAQTAERVIPYTRPAPGETVIFEGNTYTATEVGIAAGNTDIPWETYEASIGVRTVEPAGPGPADPNTAAYQVVEIPQTAEMPAAHSLVHPADLFEVPLAPAPTIELGYVEEALPESSGVFSYRFDADPPYQEALVPAEDEDMYRLPLYCSGLLGRLYFDHNSRTLNEDQRARLDEMLPAFGCPQSRLVVSGFTDTTGREDYNVELGLDRARNVAEQFIAADRTYMIDVYASTYGEEFNEVPTGDGVRESENRRVQIYFDNICVTADLQFPSGERSDLGDMPKPYVGANENGEFSPIIVALNKNRSDERGYLELSEELDFYVDQLVSDWNLPRGAIFPMIFDDWCLRPDATGPAAPSRIDIGYSAPGFVPEY